MEIDLLQGVHLLEHHLSCEENSIRDVPDCFPSKFTPSSFFHARGLRKSCSYCECTWRVHFAKNTQIRLTSQQHAACVPEAPESASGHAIGAASSWSVLAQQRASIMTIQHRNLAKSAPSISAAARFAFEATEALPSEKHPAQLPGGFLRFLVWFWQPSRAFSMGSQISLVGICRISLLNKRTQKDFERSRQILLHCAGPAA